MFRRDLNGENGGAIASITTSTNAAGTRVLSDTVLSAPTVDNNFFLYFLKVDVAPVSIGTLSLRSVRLEYTVTGSVY
ncbi:MAG: hypothetical protein ACOYN0_16050 [Phycisphaerales bacterium]